MMNEFEIGVQLGEGSYSKVYKVKRKSDQQVYAMKIVQIQKLSQKEQANALNEVRILASIKNNYIIKYKQAFIDNKAKTLNLVMELASKGDLFNLIKDHKQNKTQVKEDNIWQCLGQCLSGLASLHSLNTLHRDLKSANIFIKDTGSFAIADLNVAKVVDNLALTQTGTPYYASPEVWRDTPYGPKSDIWSLGIVIYELTMLKVPFKANNLESLFKLVQSGIYKPLCSIYSQSLSNIISSMLQVNPQLRPSPQTLLNKYSSFFQQYIQPLNLTTNVMLKTIHFPNNLAQLKQILPKSQYLSQSQKQFNNQ